MTEKEKELPQWIALCVITGIAFFAAILLGLIGLSISTYSEAGIAARSTVSMWSNYLLIVGAIGLVGCLVLSGVQAMFRRERDR